MKDQDVHEQILALRKEFGALSDSLLNLRREETRRVAGSQWRSILKERIDRFFSQTNSDGDPAEENIGIHKAELEELVDRFIDAFQTHGGDRASRVLEEFEDYLSPERSGHLDSDFVRFAYEIVRQMKEYLEVSENLTDPVKRGAGSLLGPSRSFASISLSPTAAESILSPLANAWRIDILLRLAREDENLTDISTALGLKKGHLQFHLTRLLESGYIRYDRKTRLYSITSQGIIALDEITKMVERLRSID